MKIEKIEFSDEQYPRLLRNIKNPPKQLYILGNAELLNNYGIAVIGSRNCTEIGAKNARKFAEQLSSVGICINSGMARGIDTQAHIGAMKEAGKTVAVLGCGLNNIFPKENTKLFNDILENGGAIISEYEPNEEAESKKFIQRNRIVSGMSIGVLVVEAAINSGTGITARFARQEGKPVFAIPHNINEKLGKGTNHLLQLGAKCVLDAQNILDEYIFLKDLKIHNLNETKLDLNKIPNEYKDIYMCIENKSCNIDTICKLTSKSITDVNAILTMMELDGLIKRLPGNIYDLAD